MLTPPEDLCLTYANTRFWRGRGTPTETLKNWSDLLDWLGGDGGVQAATIETIRAWASPREADAERLYAEAIEMRELLYELFRAAAEGVTVPVTKLGALNHSLERAPPRRRLVPADGGFAWDVHDGAPTVPSLLAPVLWSAGDLLTRLDQRRVRRCADDECLWLFIDHSKGRTRRWCDMKACGNRAKSRRHYLRSRSAAAD